MHNNAGLGRYLAEGIPSEVAVARHIAFASSVQQYSLYKITELNTTRQEWFQQWKIPCGHWPDTRLKTVREVPDALVEQDV